MTAMLTRFDLDVLAQTARLLAGETNSAKDAKTPGELAKLLDPKTVQTTALELIDAALVDAAEGRCDRLMISLPPQEGKSVRVSRRFPEFLLARNPNLRIAIISYAHGVARRLARSIRDDISVHSGALGIAVSPTSSAAHEWSIAGHDGEVYATGIAGSLTSRPVDCLRGDSQIMTEYGHAPIRQLCESGDAAPRVLSFNHATGKPEWRRILATRTIHDRPLVEIVTSSGRRVVCTPDHLIYVAGRGYVRAHQLRAGDRLTTAEQSADQMPALRDGDHPLSVVLQEAPRGRAALLLQDVPVFGRVDDADLRGLRHRVREAPLRDREGRAEGLHPGVLHEDVLPVHVEQERVRAGDGAHSAAADRTDHQRRAGAHRFGPASVLHGGDCRAVGRHQPEAPVRTVRCNPQEQECDLQAVLPSRPRVDLPDAHLHAMLGAVRENAGRARVSRAGRSDERVLPVRMPSPVDAGEQPNGPLRPLRKADQGGRREAVLLGWLSSRRPRRAARVQEPPLPAVRRRLHPEVLAPAVLRPDLRRPGALGTHDRRGELALQGRHELRRVVPADASPDPGARREPVPGVLGSGSTGTYWPQRPPAVEVASRGPSPQRGAGGQPAGEPDPAVLAVPHAAPQVGFDTVSVVRDLRGERDTVYDIQVDGNSNFFADQILVHNCLIIDDPYKNGEQADSEAWQEVVRDFWTEVAVPRLGPGAIVIIVQTRWRDDDLSGWLQAEDTDGHWRVINIPAQADHDPNKGETDPLGREPGEYLESARGRTTEEWERRQVEVGSRTWNALFQGRPAPASGNIFKAEWFPFYDTPQWFKREDGSFWAIGFDEVIASWDMTFKDTDGTDYVCGQVWGRRGIQAYLLDQVHDRMSFVETCNAVRLLAAKWPQALLKLVEDKANGPAVLSALARKVPGLVPEQPEGSKVARAAAVSPFAESGNVLLPAPELAPWVDGLIEELKTFPRAKHDDRTDTLTQAVRRLLLDPLLTEIDVYEDEEQEDAEGSISMY